MTDGLMRQNGLQGVMGITVPGLPSSEGHVKHTSINKATTSRNVLRITEVKCEVEVGPRAAQQWGNRERA